jgi:Ca2+-binding RTX toxin-like protein
MGFKQRQCAVAIAAVAVTGAWTGSAHAATVAVDGDVIAYQAASGEANALTVRDDGVAVSFSDAGAGIQPGAGCVALPTGDAACLGGPTQLAISVGDRDDSVDAETNILKEIRIDGGTGDDTLHSGSASGRLHALNGGSGDDELTTAVNIIGTQVLSGGAGNDSAWAQGGGFGELIGGSGHDSLRYTQRVPGQAPSRMDGGSGNDTYRWEGPDPFDDDFAARAIAPGDDFDTLRVDLGPFGSGVTVDLAACHGCVDRVIGSDLDDVLLGDSRVNVLEGRGGNDTIDPRGGLDAVDGGGGDDTIMLRDRLPDLVTCGDGEDSVSADGRLLDHVGKSCETVLRSAS